MIIDLYANAVEKIPQNEEFLAHLFMAYVRDIDFKGQQQTASKMTKMFKSNRYVFWNIMSLVMQVRLL